MFNAISRNSTTGSDILRIVGIEEFPDNTLSVFNKWGALVFEVKNYNNTTNAFYGNSNRGNIAGANSELPNDTYYYLLEYSEGVRTKRKMGYLYIK